MPAAQRNVEEIRAGVDWLSATVPITERARGWWATRCKNAIYGIAAEGFQLKERVMLGYRGFSAGNNFIGEREDGFFLQLTGSHAGDYFMALYEPFVRVSRLDIQVTVRFAKMPTNIARKGFHDAIRKNNTLPEARRRKIYVVLGSDGGDTLYVGSPSSEQRGRLYNKEKQSEDPSYSRMWRYECMFRNDAAKAIASEVFKGGTAFATIIQQLVSDWYDRRGISVKPITSIVVPVLPIIRTLPSDVESRLEWVRKQVAPAMRFLIEAGFRSELDELLNLPPVEEV